jgi:hypothetical protein
MNRGDRKEATFRDDSDRSLFLDTLGEACAKTDWQVHAYCLMNNHFLVGEELKQRRWKQEPLKQRPNGDVEKVKIAERLRCETTMTLAWIAEQLRMGTKTQLVHRLNWKKRDRLK